MATPDPGSGSGSLFGVGNKLQSKMNSFREVIERKKLEIRRVSKEMRSLIEKKEGAIIQELETIWGEVKSRMEKKKTETQGKIEKIKFHKVEMENIFQNLNPTSKPKIDISDSIDSVKREMDIDIPNVKLTWRMDELKDFINRMCRCEQKILVYNEDTQYQLKWSKCELGKGENQLYHPWGLATNPMNENIYVADKWNDRVQIFSKDGEWIRFVKDDEMENLENILFLNQSIFIQCNRTILKLNESSEKKEISKSYDFPLGGICTDNIHIYVGQSREINLIVLTLDLIEENRISLKNKFFNQHAEIRDIALSHELFYVLLFNTKFSIQAFSGDGILTRCVVRNDSINNAYCFCFDQQHNIFVADYGDSQVKIFSNEGKLLTQFGEKGSEEGQFLSLTGISAFQHDSIITADFGKIQGKLQFFCPTF